MGLAKFVSVMSLVTLAACQYEALHQNGGPAGRFAGPGGGGGGVSLCGTPAEELPPDFGQLTDQVFRPHCYSCHSSSFAAAGLNLENYAQAKALAPLVESAILSDRMPRPPVPPLNADLKALVQAWVAAGAPEVVEPEACPDPEGIGSGGPITPAPNPMDPVPSFPMDKDLNYALVRDQVLAPRCLACHSGGFGASGVNLDSYQATLQSLRDVQEVIEDNEMPPRPRPPLDERERYIVLRWIEIGAPE